MSDILYFLIFGALIYLMMRKGGCGMGHGHGNQNEGHSHSESHALPKGGDGTKRKDPLCEMDVDIDSAEQIHPYNGRTYYFCSEGCRAKFADSPDKFLAGKQRETGYC